LTYLAFGTRAGERSLRRIEVRIWGSVPFGLVKGCNSSRLKTI